MESTQTTNSSTTESQTTLQGHGAGIAGFFFMILITLAFILTAERWLMFLPKTSGTDLKEEKQK
jgi:hypothetical protein